jgi:hypothetical protein
MVTEPTGWAYDPAWTGNIDAAGITGVHRPEVLDTAEWDEHDRRARAELMTLAPGRAIATDMALCDRVNLNNTWWADLRASLDTLAAYPTDRICLDTDLLRLRILASFSVSSDHADQPQISAPPVRAARTTKSPVAGPAGWYASKNAGSGVAGARNR